jgi:hypothetical protein
MISQNLKAKTYHTQTSGSEDFLARTSLSQEDRTESEEIEVDYILHLLKKSKAKKKKINPGGLLLRTLKTCYRLMEAMTFATVLV